MSKKPPVLTSFSKAVPGHIAVSFARSARDNCDTACRIWDQCYASRIERIYPTLERKLGRHYRSGPTAVARRATAEIKRRESIPWARISVDGSLPPRAKVRNWNAYKAALREMISAAQLRGARWHIPVESFAKARTYRAALSGLGVVVRRTSQAMHLADVLGASDPISWIVGRIHAGAVSREETRRNTELAYDYARQAREAGKTAVVCPAVARNNQCGKCTACADHRVDIVFYPFHA